MSASSISLDPRKVKLGIAPIGWSNDDMPELGGDIAFERCVAEMAEAGYEGCEVGRKFPRDPASLLRSLSALRLEVAGGWCSLYLTDPARVSETHEVYRRHLDFLRALGARVAVVCECTGSVQTLPRSVFSDRPCFDSAAWKELTRHLQELGSMTRSIGMHLVYHHHLGTGIQTEEEARGLLQATDPELVSLVLDTGHLVAAGGDPVRLLREFGPRVRHIHLKDLREDVLSRVRDEGLSFLEGVRLGMFTVPGDGMIDFAPILDAIHDLEYEGWLIVEAEQDPRLANPLEYARRARSFLRESAGI